ncbi:MAG: hypothetical protein M3Z32_07140 [Acidobacteriota bacterium]|nr:hypothetical protein [Acidobacteriota bacterium]
MRKFLLIRSAITLGTHNGISRATLVAMLTVTTRETPGIRSGRPTTNGPWMLHHRPLS